ncbi:MAG TPA: hypothetical protein VM260_24635, partial [Pirellula sp.]|nr:hypothetical protein [Pirellula sp.]
LLLWLTANGVRAGINSELVMQNYNGANRATVATDTVQTPVERQAAIDRIREAGRDGSWWAFAGILLSMIAAIGGAMVGPVELTVRRDTRHYRDQRRQVPRDGT